MNKCLKITFHGELSKDFLKGVVQKSAQKLNLEGTVQRVRADGLVTRVIACGAKESVEEFLDLIYEKAAQSDAIQVEPFLKDRDYRGIFRVIE